MKPHLSLLGALNLVLFAGCQAIPPDLEAEGETLMQLSRDWSDLAATGDVDAIMAYWADDARVFPPGMQAVEGKAAIREYVKAAMQIPGFAISWEPLSVHVASSGDMAYMIERNRTTVTDSLGSPVTTEGKVVTIWEKDDQGAWKNIVDTWNSVPPTR